MFIPTSDMTYLIGASGPGKITIGQLLMQSFTSYDGQILLDGTALDSMNEVWLRCNITLVE
jgi:ABC-type multidrug transport system fused ATPase/permease subunit